MAQLLKFEITHQYDLQKKWHCQNSKKLFFTIPKRVLKTLKNGILNWAGSERQILRGTPLG